MRAPKKKVYQSGEVRFRKPDKEWLYSQYIVQKKSTTVIAEEVKATARSVRLWLRDANIPLRTRVEVGEAHSLAMSGDRNPNWVGGDRRSHKSALRRLGTPEVCIWCGQGWEGDYSMHLHHKDHDKRNGALENLCWMCGACHRLETALWNLVKQGKIDLECDGESRTMVIRFKQGERKWKQQNNLQK